MVLCSLIIRFVFSCYRLLNFKRKLYHSVTDCRWNGKLVPV